MKLLSAFVIALGTLIFSSGSSAQSVTRLDCGSFRGKYAECSVPFKIRSVRLVRQYSDRDCRLGRSYGITAYGQSIWVDEGCRGVFEVEEMSWGHGPGHGPGRPDYPHRPGPGRPYPPRRVEESVFSCASLGDRLNSCYVDGRILNVQILSQQSSSPCIYGRTYGTSPDARAVFVNRGCRAVFKVTYEKTWF